VCTHVRVCMHVLETLRGVCVQWMLSLGVRLMCSWHCLAGADASERGMLSYRARDWNMRYACVSRDDASAGWFEAELLLVCV
jgi:hypothetical protein